MIGLELREGADGVEWLVVRDVRADVAFLRERLKGRECLPSACQCHTIVCRSGDPRDRHKMVDDWPEIVLHDDVAQRARQPVDDQPCQAAGVSIRTLNVGAERNNPLLCRPGPHATLVVAVERASRATAYKSRSS